MADEKTKFFLDSTPITEAEAKKLVTEFYKDRSEEVFAGLISGKYTGAVHHKGRVTYKP